MRRLIYNLKTILLEDENPLHGKIRKRLVHWAGKQGWKHIDPHHIEGFIDHWSQQPEMEDTASGDEYLQHLYNSDRLRDGFLDHWYGTGFPGGDEIAKQVPPEFYEDGPHYYDIEKGQPNEKS
jgi:hypothetical protein